MSDDLDETFAETIGRPNLTFLPTHIRDCGVYFWPNVYLETSWGSAIDAKCKLTIEAFFDEEDWTATRP
jgi:hypothetical protein